MDLEGEGTTWLFSAACVPPCLCQQREGVPYAASPPGTLGLQGAPRVRLLAVGQVHVGEARGEGTRSWASSWILSCSDPGLASWRREGAPMSSVTRGTRVGLSPSQPVPPCMEPGARLDAGSWLLVKGGSRPGVVWAGGAG